MLRKSNCDSKSANLRNESSRKKHNILFGLAESEEDDQIVSDNLYQILLSSESSL